MPIPVSELQGIAPSAIIELFELQLNTAQHGTNDIYRFHAGANLNNNGELIWAGNNYMRFPLEAEGFEYSGNGQLPRPKIRVSNIFGTITALLLSLPGGLEGAKVTRIRTLARYLDAANFPGNVNPLGTPDSTAEFPREIYFVDRKSTETRDVVEYELAASFDLAGIRSPKRQCVSNICQWVYKSAECGYSPAGTVAGTYSLRAFSGSYSQSGATITVSSAGHGALAGDGIYLTRNRVGSGTYAGNILTASTTTITLASHGYGAGETVNLTFTSGPAPASGNYTIASVPTANTFTVITALFFGNRTGNVTVTTPHTFSDFLVVTSASANSFTVNVGTSSTQTGSISAALLRIAINNHGLGVGSQVNLSFTSGSASSGSYIVSAVTANTYTVQITGGSTTSGSVAIYSFFDAKDVPTLAASQDECGKRLSSCKARFGASAELPFGSFPGIGAYFA